MKKIKIVSVLVLSVLGLTLTQPTSALVQSASIADVKSLVIIDAYFDSRVIGVNVSCTTPLDQPCLETAKPPYPTTFGNAVNHGNALVEVAKKQNPAIKIIALYSADSTRATNSAGFIPALNWVDKNSTKVAAVSFSGYFSASPARDKTIRDLISKLKSKNIPVFVATGNVRGTQIGYPASILDTVSVSTGSRDSLGVIQSGHAFNETTDYVASADVSNFTSPVFPLIPHSTSFAAVAVAAQWVTKGTLTDRVVSVLP